MKSKYAILIVLILAPGVFTRAQDAGSLMKLVLENNRALIAAREVRRTAVIKASTGNTPPDPEVEVGYLFGDPSDIGPKINVMVKQEADFPTTYVSRSRIKMIRNSMADLEYQVLRQEVLAQARKLWIEHIYLKQLRVLYEQRSEEASRVSSHVEAMMQAGEVGALELGQAQLMLASLEGEFQEVLSQEEISRLALEEISGGYDVQIPDTLFPEPLTLTLDSLLVAYREGPAAVLYEKRKQQKRMELNLARSKHLPRLSAGYFSEAVPSEAFRGFTLGLSIPLWQNSKTVASARADVMKAGAEMDRFFLEQEMKVRRQMEQVRNLSSRIEKLEEALGTVQSLKLLDLSLKNGEISLSEYYYTSEIYFRNRQILLRSKRDLLSLETGLVKIYL